MAPNAGDGSDAALGAEGNALPDDGDAPLVCANTATEKSAAGQPPWTRSVVCPVLYTHEVPSQAIFRRFLMGLVSAGYQPSAVEPDSYDVTFSEDRAEFIRHDGTISTTLTVAVSPEDDAEVRRVSISNFGDQARDIDWIGFSVDSGVEEIQSLLGRGRGSHVRRRRQEAERSLTELAEAAELSPAYLSEVERGLKDVSMERLLAIAKALEIPVADLYLDLARSLGSRDAMSQQRSWPDDPRLQLRIATANLRPQALRSVAHFSLYLAATQATPPRRRIGFTFDR